MNELEILNFYNSWWLTGKVPSSLLKKYQREAFFLLEARLPYEKWRRILSLIGPRQTGKTTLLYQLINSLLEAKISPQRILFLSISDPLFANNLAFLEKCLEIYEREVLGEPLNNLKEPVYIFLDEIQYLDGWELWLKRYYDLGYKIKFVVSGSASSKIIQKGRESLAGRIEEVKLYPLSFREFLDFRFGEKERTLYYFSWENRGIWRDLFRFKSFSAFGKKLREKKAKVAAMNNQALIFLREYWEKGGFPGVYQYSDKETIYRYLNQDVLERVTALDIPQISQIRDVRLLQTLLLTVAQRTGSLFSYQKLALESGVRQETIRSYLYYLSLSFLISEIWQFRRAEAARFKAGKKFYICDLGLRRALLKYFSSPADLGAEAETLVFNHLRKEEEKKISFWRQEGKEVDFVLDSGDFILPIEVKYKENISPLDLKGLRKFLATFGLEGGVVITKSLFDFVPNEKIFLLPLWFFLLLN